MRRNTFQRRLFEGRFLLCGNWSRPLPGQEFQIKFHQELEVMLEILRRNTLHQGPAHCLLLGIGGSVKTGPLAVACICFHPTLSHTVAPYGMPYLGCRRNWVVHPHGFVRGCFLKVCVCAVGVFPQYGLVSRWCFLSAEGVFPEGGHDRGCVMRVVVSAKGVL